MTLNLVLALTFFASAAFFWRRVSRRLPELLTLPDEAIGRRLHHEAPRWYAAVLRYRMMAKRRALKDFAAKFAGKILQRFHIILLRLDNGVVELTRRVRGGNGIVNGAVAEEKPAPNIVTTQVEIAPEPPQELKATPLRRMRKRLVARDIAPRPRRTGEMRRDG